MGISKLSSFLVYRNRIPFHQSHLEAPFRATRSRFEFLQSDARTGMPVLPPEKVKWKLYLGQEQQANNFFPKSILTHWDKRTIRKTLIRNRQTYDGMGVGTGIYSKSTIVAGEKITEKYKYNKYTVISHRRLFSQTHVSNILNILTSIHSSSPLWCSYHYITYFSYDMLIHLHINGQGSWAVVDHTKREKAGSWLKRGNSSTLFIAIMSIYRHVFYLPLRSNYKIWNLYAEWL